jgi:dihydroflavonol-4-reductase
MLGKEDIVLVTGGTGFTGRHLVRKLCSLGCQVRVIARQSSELGDLAKLDINWYRGDVFDQALVAEATQGIHYVFHVAAAFREAKVATDIYHKVHVDSTRYLAEAVHEQPQFKRFIHTSTIGVHGHIENPPANEESEFKPGDIYQNTKLEGELWIRAYAKRTGLPLTVVRPAAIYGPEDLRMLKTFKLAQMPLTPVLGRSKGYLHLIRVEDLTDFMLYCADNPETLGEVYICGNEQAISYKEVIRTINTSLGKSSTFINLPASPFFVLGFLCEVLCKPLNIEPPLYRRRVAFFTKDRNFDTSKMMATGFTPGYDNETGLATTARWYIDNNVL